MKKFLLLGLIVLLFSCKFETEEQINIPTGEIICYNILTGYLYRYIDKENGIIIYWTYKGGVSTQKIGKE